MTTWLPTAAVAILGAVLLWGLVAPRNQWRVLFGWSARDPDESEPGDALHGLRRAISALGLLGLLVVGGLQLGAAVLERPAAAPEPSAVELMWGAPTPRLVDRVVVAAAESPEGYVPGRLGAYQPIDRGYPPNYLAELGRFTLLGDASPSGLVGSAPVEGFTGYGAGDLIVEATGPLACIPRWVVATESEQTVQIDVLWGLPGAVDQDHVAGCDPSGVIQQTLLVPVQLGEELGERLLVDIDGVPLVEVDDLAG